MTFGMGLFIFFVILIVVFILQDAFGFPEYLEREVFENYEMDWYFEFFGKSRNKKYNH